jgi:hypothetical protein
MSPYRRCRTTLAIALAWLAAVSAHALPLTPSALPDTGDDVPIVGEALPPLAEFDVVSLRAWMNHSLGPALMERREIDPGAWPLLEFEPPGRNLGVELELRLDLPALDRQD